MAFVGFQGLARHQCAVRNSRRLSFEMFSGFPSLKHARTSICPRQSVLELAEPVTVSTTVRVPRLQFGTSQDQGMRPYMEDRHAILRAGHATVRGRLGCNVAAVFDGHGGHATADYISTHLPHEVASHPLFQHDTGAEEVEEGTDEVFKAAFHNVDEMMKHEAGKLSRVWIDGSTALVAVQRGSTIFTANAGDCRAVLCRNGQGYRLTRDHTPNDPAEQRRIRMAGGRLKFKLAGGGWRVIGHNNITLGVSRGLGDFAFKEPRRLVSNEPDVVATPLTPGDAFVILASDGLWAVMDDAEAVGIAADLLSGCSVMNASGWPASDFWANMAAKALVDEAVGRGTSDNVTALVVLLDWSH